MLVVGTVRTGEQHADEELLTELSLEPAAVVLRPAALSQETTAALVGRRLGEPVSPLFALACHRTTSGNPLLLRQLLRALEADRVRPDAAHADMVVAVGSRAVSSMVLMRLRRLAGLGADRSRGRPPCWATARPAGGGRAGRAAGERTPRPRSPRSPGPRSSRTSSRWPSCTRWSARRSTATCPAAERALRHERAAQLLRAAGASDEQVAAHLLLAPARGDEQHRRGPAPGRPHGRRPRGLRQRRHAPAAGAGGAPRRRDPVRRPRRARPPRVADRRRRQHRAPAAGLCAAGGPADAGRHRRGDRPHRGLRQSAGDRDRVRAGGGHGAAAGARRPPAGAAGHRADQRLHARAGAVGVADGGPRGAHRSRASARACSPPPSPSRR